MRAQHICFILFLVGTYSVAIGQNSIAVNNENTYVDHVSKKLEGYNKQAPLEIYLTHDTSSINSNKSKLINDELDDFCEKLLRKKNKLKELNFLQYVFYKTHKKFLKTYQLNSPLYKTFENGHYDCVSGTALYSIILEKLKIPHSIKETKFHVYLLTYYNKETQLFESTDPFGGYITDHAEIKSREEVYDQQQEKTENIYVYNKKINEEIDIVELAGLEFYNRGIQEYNNKNILESLNYFEKALKLYNSPRIEDIFRMSLEILAKEIKYSKSLGLAKSYEYYSKLLPKKVNGD